MQLFTMVVLAVTATCDSLLIGLNYGVKQVRIPWRANLLISALCFLGTWSAMYAGGFLEQLFPAAAVEKLGGLLLTGLGLSMAATAFRPSCHDYCDCIRANPRQIDRNHSSAIEARESLSLGVVLAANNIGVGLGASMIGLSPLATSILCGIMSFLFLSAGCRLGQRLRNSRIAGAAEKASACLLLVLGLLALI